MTMDMNHTKRRDAAEIHVTEVTEVKPTKRSFDVAFLMLPDEKLKQKQLKAKLEAKERYELEEAQEAKAKIQNSPQKTQVFDDPNLGKLYEVDYQKPYQKSAFTKVSARDGQISPNLSMSPDLQYQNSLSPSPPTLNRPYQNFSAIPNQVFKSQTYQHNFPVENQFSGPSTSLDHPFLIKPPTQDLGGFAKMRPLLQYRPELPYYGFQQEAARNPAAAILSSLLPPSFAALSLPAQNVCAKCNISFRMTSDLVYHMRSHHKNDVASDLSKRRREEKLKCPVCSESFRERHHLTRHMTAHQDKEGDSLEPQDTKKKAFAYNK